MKQPTFLILLLLSAWPLVPLPSFAIGDGQISGEEYGKRALLAYAADNPADAIHNFDQALQINPNDGLSLCLRSVVKRDMDDMPGAMADVNRCIGLRPGGNGDSGLYLLRGSYKHAAGDVQGAMADYNTASKKNDKAPEPYYYWGCLLHDKGDLDTALSEFDCFIELNGRKQQSFPDQAVLRSWIIRAQLGDPALANRDLAVQLEERSKLPPTSNPCLPFGDLGPYFTIIANYLLDRLDDSGFDEAVIKEKKPAAQPTGIDPRLMEELFSRHANICQLHYYRGAKKLIRGDCAGAADCFRTCLATGVRSCEEYTSARIALDRITAAGRIFDYRGRTVQLTANRLFEMTGIVREAVLERSSGTGYSVRISLTSEGARRMADFSAGNSGNEVGMLLDGRLINVATLQTPLAADIEITGLTEQEAKDLVAKFPPPRQFLDWILFTLLVIVLWCYPALCLQRIARKSRAERGWMAWIPVANLFLLSRLAKCSAWLLLLLLVPGVGSVYLLVLLYRLPEAVGVTGAARLLILVPLVNLIYLGYLAFKSEEAAVADPPASRDTASVAIYPPLPPPLPSAARTRSLTGWWILGGVAVVLTMLLLLCTAGWVFHNYRAPVPAFSAANAETPAATVAEHPAAHAPSIEERLAAAQALLASLVPGFKAPAADAPLELRLAALEEQLPTDRLAGTGSLADRPILIEDRLARIEAALSQPRGDIPAKAPFFKHGIYEDPQSHDRLSIITDDELEYKTGGVILLCKYTIRDSQVRLVATVQGTPQVFYFTVTSDGLKGEHGTFVEQSKLASDPLVQGKNNARQLVIACMQYALEHEGKFPATLADVAEYLGSNKDKIFVCPLSPAGEPVGFEYFGGKDTDPPANVLLRSKATTTDGLRIIAHIDGSVDVARDKP